MLIPALSGVTAAMFADQGAAGALRELTSKSMTPVDP